ncbi:MAG: glycoside hydrolase family 99-like domain-containing protein [Lachnospiraceae bacterium]|nr:glycoside hydrolase family 99-like domain-containing protein [Lachnospiraceae bacterium]
MKSKIIAFYLPQYHRIPENDKWWGEGFTDWDAVRKADKIFPNHNQPRVPIDRNYYNLLDEKTLKWQSELMNQYGIDGMCFYHYCFKENKLLLERPAELLLNNKEIQMPFCFCWANESWINSWSNIQNSNVWSYKFERTRSNSDSKFLAEQSYGDRCQWEAHFHYLRSFFCDKRYICIENKPVFLIYKPALIPCLEEMKECWNKLAQEIGFDGIYLIGANCGDEYKTVLNANYYHEPLHTKNLISTYPANPKLPCIIDYDDIWNGILGHSASDGKTFWGGFVSYDDTPRHELRGTVVINDTPEKFKQYLAKLLAKNIVYQNELTFINAWNEWGEGMYLEPDEKNRYQYLEAVKFAKEHCFEYFPCFEQKKDLGIRGLLDRCEKIERERKKDLCYLDILDKWLYLHKKRLFISDVLRKKNIKTIAIYGVGKLGKHLWEELYDSDVEVVCAIDRNRGKNLGNLKIHSIDQDIPQVDAVIIAVSFDTERIFHDLSKKKSCNNVIMTIEELINEGISIQNEEGSDYNQ